LAGGLAALFVALFGEGIFGASDEQSAAGPVGASVEDLVRATVQISAKNDADEAVWWGSGSVISRDGLILTAAHIVDDRLGEYEYLEVGVTDSTSEPPLPRYRATIAAADYALDLAVIRIDSDLGGNKVVIDRPFVALGDSSRTEILERVRILGYPRTGGTTLTATSGTVSGFASVDEIDGRAYIKSDATVLSGGSGGMAVNDDGELIAIPVQFGSDSLDIVDCLEQAQDTNGDGLTDQADDCVTAGGFINSLRPINLAIPLVEAARARASYEPRLTSPDPWYEEVPTDATFENLRITGGLVESQQPGPQQLPSGARSLCASWTYTGMVDGTRWDAIWYLDDFRLEEETLARQRWDGGDEGTGGPICIGGEAPLAAGYYELILSVGGVPIADAGLSVGHVNDSADLSLLNNSSSEICGLYMSRSEWNYWGPNDLASGETIKPGAIRSFVVRDGRSYDIRAVDCGGQEVDVHYGVHAAKTTDASVTIEP
jgi:S1-C subfamily serine protease